MGSKKFEMGSKRLRRKTGTNHKPKRLKTDESIEEPIEQTKISDLFQECLEHIFSYLDLADLLNVADVDRSFQKATYVPFKQKYARKSIEIRSSGIYNHGEASRELFHVEESKIAIGDSKMGLQLLRSFGHLISRLHLNTGGVDGLLVLGEMLRAVSEYVEKYCMESLTKITFGFFTLEEQEIMNCLTAWLQ